MSGKIGLATITEITERMKKVRPADLGEITTDFYNWINCVINYYHALDLHAAEQTPQKAARPNTSRTRTTARKYKSPHPSQVGQYIRASTTSRESQRASLDNIMRSYDNPYVRNWVALEMDSKELANLKSVERRKVWDEKRELRKTNSEKQLKTERDDITFRNKERKRMINIEAKAITEEQKTRREYIDQRKQDYDEIRKVKEDSNRKSMMCILQRGKERSKLAQKETTGQIKTSRMKEICLSEFLRPDDVNEVKAQEQRNQEVVVGKRRRQILAERNDIKKIIDKYN